MKVFTGRWNHFSSSPLDPVGLTLLRFPSPVRSTLLSRSSLPLAIWSELLTQRVNPRLEYVLRRIPPRTLEKTREAQTEWVMQTPSVRQWLASGLAYKAPRVWPSRVEKHLEMPPSVLADNIPARTSGRWVGPYNDPRVCVLLAYAHGMSLELLSEISTDPEQDMIKAIEHLLGDHMFRLWARRYDLSSLPIPRGPEPLFERMRIREQLIQDPLLHDTPRAVERLGGSGMVMSYERHLPRMATWIPTNRYKVLWMQRSPWPPVRLRDGSRPPVGAPALL